MASEDKLSYIILGLLKHEPLTGYDLKKNFENEVGEFWQANTGQIYPTLRKLFDAEAVDFDVEIVGAKLKRPAGQPLSRTGPTAPGRHRRWYSSPGKSIISRIRGVKCLINGSKRKRLLNSMPFKKTNLCYGCTF